MTIQELQRVVLRLANQMLVRYYLWLNYPNESQLMGIQIQTANTALIEELRALGFRWHEGLMLWVVERKQEPHDARE